ncbi:MAG: hypothetical protein ACRD8O_21200 [Bryobacteraceae bacterium]
MTHKIAVLALIAAAIPTSCTKKESGEAPKTGVEAPAAAQRPAGPHAFVTLTDGSKVPGTIVASSQTDMVVAGDDGIERKIPLTQVKSVEYGEAQKTEPARQASREQQAPARQRETQQASRSSAPARTRSPVVTTRTYELIAGSELSVRTNEAIDSGTAAEGQSFDAEVTRDAKDANGDIVIPRGSRTSIVIQSASKGGRFRGASDLVLDLQSVVINGKTYSIESADISQKGKSGVGANKRTAVYTGGGAAVGAIIGAIAGGGKGAAIGAGAGAGAGALTQILTKGGSIKVPAESVLTFRLDQPLRVAAR